MLPANPTNPDIDGVYAHVQPYYVVGEPAPARFEEALICNVPAGERIDPQSARPITADTTFMLRRGADGIIDLIRFSPTAGTVTVELEDVDSFEAVATGTGLVGSMDYSLYAINSMGELWVKGDNIFRQLIPDRTAPKSTATWVKVDGPWDSATRVIHANGQAVWVEVIKGGVTCVYAWGTGSLGAIDNSGDLFRKQNSVDAAATLWCRGTTIAYYEIDAAGVFKRVTYDDLGTRIAAITPACKVIKPPECSDYGSNDPSYFIREDGALISISNNIATVIDATSEWVQVLETPTLGMYLVSSGIYPSAIGVKADGTLWRINYNGVVQVSTISDVAQVTGYYIWLIVRKTDGSLWYYGPAYALGEDAVDNWPTWTYSAAAARIDTNPPLPFPAYDYGSAGSITYNVRFSHVVGCRGILAAISTTGLLYTTSYEGGEEDTLSPYGPLKHDLVDGHQIPWSSIFPLSQFGGALIGSTTGGKTMMRDAGGKTPHVEGLSAYWFRDVGAYFPGELKYATYGCILTSEGLFQSWEGQGVSLADGRPDITYEPTEVAALRNKNVVSMVASLDSFSRLAMAVTGDSKTGEVDVLAWGAPLRVASTYLTAIGYTPTKADKSEWLAQDASGYSPYILNGTLYLLGNDNTDDVGKVYCLNSNGWVLSQNTDTFKTAYTDVFGSTDIPLPRLPLNDFAKYPPLAAGSDDGLGGSYQLRPLKIRRISDGPDNLGGFYTPIRKSVMSAIGNILQYTCGGEVVSQNLYIVPTSVAALFAPNDPQTREITRINTSRTWALTSLCGYIPCEGDILPLRASDAKYGVFVDADYIMLCRGNKYSMRTMVIGRSRDVPHGFHLEGSGSSTTDGAMNRDFSLELRVIQRQWMDNAVFPPNPNTYASEQGITMIDGVVCQHRLTSENHSFWRAAFSPVQEGRKIINFALSRFYSNGARDVLAMLDDAGDIYVINAVYGGVYTHYKSGVRLVEILGGIADVFFARTGDGALWSIGGSSGSLNMGGAIISDSSLPARGRSGDTPVGQIGELGGWTKVAVSDLATMRVFGLCGTRLFVWGVTAHCGIPSVSGPGVEGITTEPTELGAGEVWKDVFPNGAVTSDNRLFLIGAAALAAKIDGTVVDDYVLSEIPGKWLGAVQDHLVREDGTLWRFQQYNGSITGESTGVVTKLDQVGNSAYWTVVNGMLVHDTVRAKL